MAESDSVDTPSIEEENGQEGKLPSITWGSDLVDVGYLENGSGLPRVVKFEAHETGPNDIPQGLRVYTEQPVLLHTRISKNHVQARTVYHDKSGPYYEVGQTLIVPDDFEGWFEMVPQDFGRGHVCRTIAQVAEVMPQRFFTRSSLRAIRMTMEENEEGEKVQNFKDRKIPAGTVLRTQGTFVARWKTSANTGFFKKKSQEWTTVETTYLKCIDIDEEEVLVPCTAQGRFSLVYEKGVKDTRQVFRMKNLVSDFSFPLKVRMVFGKAPVVPCIFTGFLVLKEKSREDTFIGSTIMNKRNVLFEVPVSMNCKYHAASDSNDYVELRTYKDAELLCKKYALSFSTLIKLSPDLDTSQQMVQHIPTEKRKNRESLKNLDLLNDVTWGDESRDFVLDDSDTDSISAAELTPLAKGQLMELKEITLPRTSHAFTNC